MLQVQLLNQSSQMVFVIDGIEFDAESLGHQ
jgi:hypothetical protein